jgi:phage/plasmid-like protein (TIGR03299 family)
MPHNLAQDQLTDQTMMMYVRETPWHNLGQRLDNPATSSEAIRAAGLDWDVDKYPLLINSPNGNQIVNDKYVIMRSDLWSCGLGPYFGIVGKEYEILQNRDAFLFFDDIVGKSEAIFETAGALGDGERIWVLAKLPDRIHVIGDDICDKYLLLSNSHDGKSSVQMKFTPIRVVCQNTLTMALNHGLTIRISHTRNLHERIHRAENLLGIIRNAFDAIEVCFQQMAKTKMDHARLLQYYKTIFPDPRVVDDDSALQRVQRDRLVAMKYFEQGMGNQTNNVNDTLWAAYNGVTEMVDYQDRKQTLDQRLNSIWFGEGYLLKARAYRVAMEYLNTWAA